MAHPRPTSAVSSVPDHVPAAGVARPLVLLMAVACGTVVANNYYAQPLLPDLARSFHLSSGAAGLCVTLNQLGYALGLVLVVPLGDLLARRGLIVTMLALDAVALAGVAAAPEAAVLLAALAVVGLAGSAISVLIPLAATLADDGQRGRVVGTLMTGLLMGALLARTVSGALGQVTGWRVVYAVAALAVAALALVLRRRLPDLWAPQAVTYGRLLVSVTSLVRGRPALRRRMAIGAIGFACFQLCWTALPFLLTTGPFHYSSTVIGLFGLLGAAGAACAQPVGRLYDRGASHVATGALLTAVGLGWAVLVAGHHLIAVIVGILLLDIGIQGVHVLNQARLYTFSADIRSRVTTAYMTSYFLGGAVGGGIATVLYTAVGWSGVCACGAALVLVGLVLWLTECGSEPCPGPPTTDPTPAITSSTVS